MDSRLAADANARRILDILAVLENAAGVRAHYRILDPPPLAAVDASSFQTSVRVIADWIGLRNAIFQVSITDNTKPPAVVRTDLDQEEFAVMVPPRAITNPELALATAARIVSETYLVNSNIGASSIESKDPDPLLVDTTAIFLGLGKLLLNGTIPTRPSPSAAPTTTADYLAFTFRLVCAMRGLDWNQQTSGLSPEAIGLLRPWDQYRDSVFSQSLRNVLTASISHRPLLDVLSDNHLTLAKFDQLERSIAAQVIDPLRRQHRDFHEHCRIGYEKVTAREQETYDPCMLYLNQVRRRMDLQRYTDMLVAQEKQVQKRVAEIANAIGELERRRLFDEEHSTGELFAVACPFDGTRISLTDTPDPQKVKCPGCGYIFFGYAGTPDYKAEQRPELVTEDLLSTVKSSGTLTDAMGFSGVAPSSAITQSKRATPIPAILMVAALGILAVGWVPLIGMFVYSTTQHLPMQNEQLFGAIGVVGTIASLLLFLMAGVVALLRTLKRSRDKRPFLPDPEL